MSKRGPHTVKTKRKIAKSLSKYLKEHPEHGGLNYWKGKKRSKKTRKRMSESSKMSKNKGRFKKGNKPWNNGIPRASINYKGTSINGMHSFLKKWNGNPAICDFCGKKGKKQNNRWTIEYALKHGKRYTENKKDYHKLCRKCHRNYDEKFYKNVGRKKKKHV